MYSLNLNKHLSINMYSNNVFLYHIFSCEFIESQTIEFREKL